MGRGIIGDMGVRQGCAALVDLVLPADCAGCGDAVAPWCPACLPGPGSSTSPFLPGGPDVRAAGRYHGPLRTALLRYKERGRRDLAGPLADVLREPLRELADAGPLWLVPAPSRRSAARARGGDHVARLCRALAHDRPDTRVAPALVLARGVRDSVGLDAADRTANLAGRVRVRPHRLPAAGSPLLLVDDVVTTGATLRACRAALAEAGHTAARALVLCDAT